MSCNIVRSRWPRTDAATPAGIEQSPRPPQGTGIQGRPLGEGAFGGNYTCDPDAVAGPDNLAFLAGTATLVVYEDTSDHQNACLWAYRMDGGGRMVYGQRIGTVPLGAEATGGFYHQDVIAVRQLRFHTAAWCAGGM